MGGFAYSFYSLMIRSCLAAGLAMGAAIFAAPGTSHADSQKRVALVIGNGDYKIAPHLDSPANDARAIAETLRKLSFDVVDGYDLDVSQMRKAVSDFSAALPDAKSAVVFYAGHGVSVDNEDFLLPVDIDLKSPADLDNSAISMSLLLKDMKREERANIVLLDACRDNPFADELARNRTPAAIGLRGLSAIQGERARGTLIAFATDPNSTALDGVQGRHSPFTEALLNHLPDPGAPIDTVMMRVRSEVWEKTKHMQRPWVFSSLVSEFSFNPRVGTAAPEAAAPEGWLVRLNWERESLLWESARHSNLSVDYQAYLDAFPNGLFAPMAKNRIALLGSAPTTARAPEATPPTSPASPSEKELKGEIGTYLTEQYLRLEAVDRREIQVRLRVLGYYTGAIDGSFNEQTRQAIEEWQKKHQVVPTGMLGPVEIAAMQAESEEMYQRYLDSQPEKPNAQPEKPDAQPEKPDAQPEKPNAQPENPQATPSVQAPATGYHYQPYHYYRYQPHHYRRYAYRYRRHRHYYALYGGDGIFSFLSHFGF
jgi:peptidoglycan hydrolase-like protein with peptidoglycan-binding domain